MLEKIAYLQNEILQAPPEIVVPAAIFLFVALIGGANSPLTKSGRCEIRVW